MASISLQISPAPGVLNDFIAVIYKTTNEAAEIDRIIIPYPHDEPQSFEFTDIEPGTYIGKVHDTPDGETLGNIRHDFWADASLEKLNAYTIKDFQVGLGRGEPYYDPAHDSDAYENPDLKGLTYTVFKPGYGPLSWDANIEDDPDGGFSFTDGQKFFQDEVYTILISNLVTQPVDSVSASGYPDDVVVATEDVAFGSSYYNKLIEMDVATALVVITIADITTIPDGTQFGINTHKHNDVLRYVILQLPSGKYCYVNNFQRNALYIGRSAEAWFIKKGNTLRIVNWDDDHRRLGETVFTDGIPPANSLPKTGGWWPKADFPRIFNWYINRLPLSELGTGTDDVTPSGDNIYKWIIGVDKFWAPDHEDMTYKVGGTRLANSYQADAVGPADIRTTAWTGAGIGKNGVSAASVGFLATLGDGGTINSDSASGTNNNAARTGEWSIVSPTGETLVKNVATNAYVII